jgi:3-hydroxyisobutyrate dehydrogenase
MLPATQHIKELYFGETQLANKLNKNCLLIDSSTICPISTKEIASRLRNESGLEFIDAPVAGGVPGAKNATLTFMVGSNTPELFDVRVHFGFNKSDLKFFWLL